MNYFDKYLKYKKKYLELKGGAAAATTVEMTDKIKDYSEQYASLIQNLREIKQINGPISIFLFKINNRYILLFGDIHQIVTEVCKNSGNRTFHITELLTKIAEYTSYPIDIFIETVIFLNIQNEFKSIMNEQPKMRLKELKILTNLNTGKPMIDTVSKFIDCLTGNRYINHYTCPYTSARIHNIEFRRFVDSQYNISGKKEDRYKTIFHTPYLCFKKYKSGRIFYSFMEKIDLYIEIYHNMLFKDTTLLSKNILTLFSDVCTKDFIKEYKIDLNKFSSVELEKSSYMRLHKQFENLENKESIKKKIFEFYGEKIRSYINEIKKSYETYNIEAISYKGDDGSDFLDVLDDNLLNIAVVIMDTYVIGRILKSLYMYDTKLSIVYAGQAHILNYIDVLKQLEIITPATSIVEKFNPLYREEANINNCVIFDNIAEWHKIVDVLESLNKSI